ncbi:hypothetical protein KIH87_06365 [Paraneptunicella aestuarii]|uniref:hypothetical protein n=1 Tax=Paraneptunicella aestuarii TaxID=2831148 RepID=UPI001E49285B|nr:hypothetical protein [Paraneptunicella aestuarii]UAA39970.1 hypothetical protein KIH87_06365 [Paraneptunicella aestuarii]
MINQEQYRKAILSELGITQWRLSEANLLDKSYADSNPEMRDMLETSVSSEDTSNQSQPLESKSQESVLAEPTKEVIDVTGKLVIEAGLKSNYPIWFWQDLSLALNHPLEEIIWLSDSQEPQGEALCFIRVQNDGNYSGQYTSDIQLPLPADSNVNSLLNAGSKKTLWDKLQAVLKSSE